jgi:chaperonin GroES
MAYATKAERSGGEKQPTPKLASVLAKLQGYTESVNIAADLDQEDLDKIGYEVKREYDIDKKSRSEWEESATKAMDVALQVRKAKNYPFENAANIKYPLVTVAALQFGARAYPAIVDGNRIVKAQVLGADQDGQKRSKADRVSQHMSYQLLHEMKEWEEDTDVLLHHLPIVGCAFRKVWRDEKLKRNKSVMVSAVDLVVNNSVRSLEEAPRITHVIPMYPQDIDERMRSEEFLECELPMPTPDPEEGKEGQDGNDDDAPHIFLEQHRFLDLDDDGYREPYIVTVHKDTGKVVRIVANYSMDEIVHSDKKIIRIPPDQYFVKYSFIPDPKGGFYDIGFGKLLESLSETIDTTINIMLDAGHLQTAGGGFIGSGLRLKKGVIERKPGKYITVEATGGLIKDAIHNFQDPGPSAVLFNLLGMMIDAAKDITAVKDILTGDGGDKGVQTATTTLAMIEQGLKVFTAIYKRIYRALKDEFALLAKLNAKHLSEEEYFTFHDAQQKVSKSDYDLTGMDVMPVADPKMVTDMQKSARAGVLMQIAEHPTLGPLQNPEETLRRIYESVGMEEIEKLMVPPQPPNPLIEAGAVAEVKETEASAAEKSAKADKLIAETDMMTAGRDAEMFGQELEAGLGPITAKDEEPAAPPAMAPM